MWIEYFFNQCYTMEWIMSVENIVCFVENFLSDLYALLRIICRKTDTCFMYLVVWRRV